MVDPLADQMPSYSPYTYTFNNPILLVDPDGLTPNCEGCPDPSKYKEGDKTTWAGKEFNHDGNDWSHTLPEVDIVSSKEVGAGVERKDLSMSEAALSTGGLLYGIAEQIVTSENYWLGINGK